MEHDQNECTAPKEKSPISSWATASPAESKHRHSYILFTRIKMFSQEEGDTGAIPTATDMVAQNRYNGQTMGSRQCGQRERKSHSEVGSTRLEGGLK